jgi:arginyl-tRNA synthetase
VGESDHQMTVIHPIPANRGVGFFSTERLPEFASNYREENVGRYWNYYVTPLCQEWPKISPIETKKYVIDGFSPNLNKSLHVGHLRQLALAKSLDCMINNTDTGTKVIYDFPTQNRWEAKFVSLLGASQGVYQYATQQLNEWFNFLDFHPELHYDVLMPRDQEIVPRHKTKMPVKDLVATDFNGNPFEHEEECEVWDGPNGPVIVVRWDGRPLYSFQDIAFAKTVNPTHYITGMEQKEHFANLGLADKHLPMGLVLGADGKKMKSRSGDSVTAQEIIEQIISKLDATPEPKKLAWNVLAWNFLHISRSKDVKYTPEDWIKPDAPGMYISYTCARMQSIMSQVPYRERTARHVVRITPEGVNAVFDPEYDLTQSDADLIGFANQHSYYLKRSVDSFDPAMLANYTYDLAIKLGQVYHSEKIVDGRWGVKYAVSQALTQLRSCMIELGMFDLDEI